MYALTYVYWSMSAGFTYEYIYLDYKIMYHDTVQTS